MSLFHTPTARDTPEQIDLLHRAGYARTIEIDGIGNWQHPQHPFEEWLGAAAALEHAHVHHAKELRPKRRLGRRST